MLLKRFSNLLMLAVLASAIGCSSRSLRVTSSPEGADVYIIGNDRQAQKIGKTPLELDQRNAPQVFADVVQVQVAKEGYNPQMVLVPKLAMTGGTGRVNFNLEDTTLPKFCQAQGDSSNEIARGVAEVSNLIQKKRYPEASNILQSLTAKFATVSILYDLQGNIYYLQKDMGRALDSYKKSSQLSPNNVQTLNMINRIQQLQGTSSGG